MIFVTVVQILNNSCYLNNILPMKNNKSNPNSTLSKDKRSKCHHWLVLR